jgi:transcriptional regulator with XRE-family HTH domain
MFFTPGFGMSPLANRYNQSRSIAPLDAFAISGTFIVFNARFRSSWVLSSSAMAASCGNLSIDVKEPVPHRMWKHFPMGKILTSPRVRLAKNLKALVEMQGLSAYQVAELAKVDPKTVYNLLKGSFDPRLSIVEKLANAFGLTSWQILAADFEAKPPDSKQVLTLLEHYSTAKEEGRKAIMQVAEIAAHKG